MQWPRPATVEIFVFLEIFVEIFVKKVFFSRGPIEGTVEIHFF